MLTLYSLRIELGKSYRRTLDLLSEMPIVLAEIGLIWLLHSTTFCDWFEAISGEDVACVSQLTFREMLLKITVYNLRRTV